MNFAPSFFHGLPIWAVLTALATVAASQGVGGPVSSDLSHNEADSTFRLACREFGSKVKIDNARVQSTTYIPIGGKLNISWISPSCVSEGLGLDMGSGSSIEFCHVALNVSTSSSSQVYMEAWLPSNYSGRFLSTGNGGLGGCKLRR